MPRRFSNSRKISDWRNRNSEGGILTTSTKLLLLLVSEWLFFEVVVDGNLGVVLDVFLVAGFVLAKKFTSPRVNDKPLSLALG